MKNIQKFVRGFIVDPELEVKAHLLVAEMQQTAMVGRKTAEEAKETLKKIGNVKELALLAGMGLLVAGFVIGASSSVKEEEKH